MLKLKFPSPCGEMNLLTTTKGELADIKNAIVSVPLRGNESSNPKCGKCFDDAYDMVFPSPCGEMNLLTTVSMSGFNQTKRMFPSPCGEMNLLTFRASGTWCS